MVILSVYDEIFYVDINNGDDSNDGINEPVKQYLE